MAPALAVLLVTVGCGDSPTSSVRCTRPTLSMTVVDPAAVPIDPPPSVPADRIVEVSLGVAVRATGTGFGSACTPEGGDVLVGDPLTAIRLYVTQGEQRVSVAQMNAAADGHGVDVVFGVPTSLRVGRASLVAQMGEGASIVPVAVTEFEVAAG